ncbi:MAG: Zn-dependent oligopeptidase [Pontiellaceae bacterium]|nr:Zn-dependent oligopeptidase [Pontiellaceae bacterium]
MKISTSLTGVLIIISAALSYGEDMAESYRLECKQELSQSEEIFRSLEKLDGEKTIESVLIPLNEMERILYNSASKASLFYNVHPSQEIRDIAENQEQEITKLYNEISLSRPLYEACKAVDVAQADEQTQRYLEFTLRDFWQSGVDKPADVRERIKVLNEELTDLGQQFSLNTRQDVRSITLDSVDELNGLPEDFIAAHPPGEDGKITITTDYPDYEPFMQYAENDAARLALYKEFKNRSYPENEEVLKQILMKRYELANLVGYTNYAYYVTEDKMVGTPETVHTFIDKVAAIAEPRAKADYNVLLERLKKIDPAATEVGDWQKTYLEELIKKETYNVDAKQIRGYFPFATVRDGIFKLTSQMYGVTIRPWDTEVWHEDVKAYELVDGNKVIGRFFLDLHPRENKYKHAAHFDLQCGVEGKQLPISCLVCNFPGVDDENALLEHSQVETFLHEFGHLLHHQFAGNQRWVRFSGIATELDFLEAPSQMLEEWVWNADTLKLMTRNAEGKTIPADLVKRMVAAKEFGTGLWVRHQMFYAATSINIYDRDPKNINLAETMDALQDEYSSFKHVPDTHMYANFGHLYGYSAMYCTYMWSLVIAKDIYSRFETEGLLNPKTADEYRKAILSPGGSKDAVDLVQDFLGRPYSFDPFAKWLNATNE